MTTGEHDYWNLRHILRKWSKSRLTLIGNVSCLFVERCGRQKQDAIFKKRIKNKQNLKNNLKENISLANLYISVRHFPKSN